MAILFSQAEGSDQHYDTYEEFEQAFILLKRLNGEKVPQDLLDEVKAKYGDKELKTNEIEIDRAKFESAISEEVREATGELAEALDEVAKVRTPISDDCGVPDKEPKFEVGDKVRVVSAYDGTSGPYHGFRIGSTAEVVEVYGNGKIEAYNGIFHQTLLPHHFEIEGVELEDSPTDFRSGDIVKVTETFEDSYGDTLYVGDLHRFGKLSSGRVCVSTVFVDGDNIDKLQLVCRKEDRKDVEL